MTSAGQQPQINEEQRRRLDVILAVLAIAILALGTITYHYVEDWSWVDSLYFSVVAASTVGFGDLAPDTDGAKVFTVLYIISAVSIIAAWLNERMRRHGLKLAQRAQPNGPGADSD